MVDIIDRTSLVLIIMRNDLKVKLGRVHVLHEIRYSFTQPNLCLIFIYIN